jgi:hypothetical protein
MTYLADAQHRAGAIGDALETIEPAFNFNPEDASCRPETIRIRGELRLKLRLATMQIRWSTPLASVSSLPQEDGGSVSGRRQCVLVLVPTMRQA